MSDLLVLLRDSGDSLGNAYIDSITTYSVVGYRFNVALLDRPGSARRQR